MTKDHGGASKPRRSEDGIAIRTIRRIPISWRIPAAVFLNAAAALTVGMIGWYGAAGIYHGIDDLRIVQERGRKLAEIDAQSGRLQSLIRQYLNSPTDEVMKEISRRSDDLFQALGNAGQDRAPMEELVQLNEAARRLVSGFQRLKTVNGDISREYQVEIAQAAAEMSGLYGVLNASLKSAPAPELSQGLVKSHEAFVAAVIDINTFYFSADPLKADAAHRSLGELIQSIPLLSRNAATAFQRDSLAAIGRRAVRMDEGIEALAAGFDDRARVLAQEIDSNQVIMAAAVDRLSSREAESERVLRDQADRLLQRSAATGIALGIGFLAISIAAGWLVGRSVRDPLSRLRNAMEAGARGDWSAEPDSAEDGDELGAISSTFRVFRNNALENARMQKEGERMAAQEQDSQRRILQNLLMQLDAHEPGAPFSRLAEHDETGSTREFAQVFNAVLERFLLAADDKEQAEAAMRAAEARAARTARDKSDFVLGITARAAPPLNTVAECLARLDEAASPQARQALTTAAQGAVEAVQKIIQAARVLVELDAELRAPVPTPVNLSAIIETSAHRERAAAAAKGIDFRIFVDPAAALPFMGDPELLRRAVSELCAAAIERTRRGRISVFAHWAPPTTTEGDAKRNLRIIVAVSGPGSPADCIGDPFAPFAAASETGSRSSGLGLAIARSIARVLGGTLAFHPAQGDGGSFVLDFPPVPLPAPVDETENESGIPDLMGLRLLVLAPNAAERALIARWVEQCGAAVVRVAGAESAKMASERAADTQAPFDLAVISTQGFDSAQADMMAPTPFLLVGPLDLTLGLERHPLCLGVSAAAEPTWALTHAVSRASTLL